MNLHEHLPFLPEKMDIEKVEKFVANLHKKRNISLIGIQKRYIESSNLIKKLGLNHTLIWAQSSEKMEKLILKAVFEVGE